jgi:hypothetical protein
MATAQFDLQGVHPYLGLVAGGGAGAFAPSDTTASKLTGYGAFHFAVQGGVFLDRIQLGFEFSPASTFTYAPLGLAAFHGSATLGYMLRLGDHLSWPLRMGVGGGFLFSTTTGLLTVGVFEARAEPLGLLYTIPVGANAVAIHLTFPSFVYLADFQTGAFLTWVATMGMSYVFQ